MAYPDTTDQDTFFDQYFEAIESADFPEISEIRDLIFDVLGKMKFPPNNPKLWPLFTFISKALDEKAPINWLTGPVFAEKLPAIRQVLDFLESNRQDELIQIKDKEGKSIPVSMANRDLRNSAALLLLQMPKFPTQEKEIDQALRTIKRLEVTLGDGTIADIHVIHTAEFLEKSRKMIMERILKLDEQGELRFETQNGNPFGRHVETSQILDGLADLVIQKLRVLPITDLSMIDHLHVTIVGQKAIEVKLCAKPKDIHRMLREQMKKR